jgi:FemAB-related protein (PEP-CTERM system-associated)
MVNPVHISVCTEADASRWDSFLDSQDSGSFYHRFAWKQINEQNFGHETFFLVAQRGEQIVGLFPLVLVSTWLFGRILCSMPFVNYGGPCSNDAEAMKLLLDEMAVLANRLRADYTEIRTLEPLAREFPSSLHKVSMTLALQADPDTLWNAFTSKHRTNIRRVYKDGVRVESGHAELLDTFYQVLAESWRQHGTPMYRRRYFADILAAFPQETRIFVVWQDETPVAAAFNGYYRDTVEGMWAGTDNRYRHLQTSYVLYWEMIKDACERGFKHYHLGRSSVESGGEAFKKKWNAEIKQLYWSYHLSPGRVMPQLNVNNPKYRLAIELWRRLPTGLTTLIGPPLARGIP